MSCAASRRAERMFRGGEHSAEPMLGHEAPSSEQDDWGPLFRIGPSTDTTKTRLPPSGPSPRRQDKGAPGPGGSKLSRCEGEKSSPEYSLLTGRSAGAGGGIIAKVRHTFGDFWLRIPDLHQKPAESKKSLGNGLRLEKSCACHLKNEFCAQLL